MAIMVVAAMLSTGGFARHAHLWSAHSHGGTCSGASRETLEYWESWESWESRESRESSESCVIAKLRLSCGAHGSPTDFALRPDATGTSRRDASRSECDEPSGSAQPRPDVPCLPGHSSHPGGDCSVCAQLAHLTPDVPIGPSFTTVLEVLAIVHDREASQLPEPSAPDICSARPPPAVA